MNAFQPIDAEARDPREVQDNRHRLSRRGLLGSAALAAFAAGSGSGCQRGLQPKRHASGGPRDFELSEVTIDRLQQGMERGEYTAESIAETYLARIEQVDKSGPAVNAVIEVNPDALSIASELDQERKTNGPRGPLHGIPVILKDNLDTGDRMQTTAGSLALEGSIAPHDSFVAEQLRQAGAVILAKANLTEWANFRGGPATSGWSARGGLTRNPYVLDRNACGSSSGSAVAVAANLCPLAIGTETNGSIICPSSINGVVGIKPTVGLVSRSGIIPISHTQDTAGPIARTVKDAALLLGALTRVDPADAATRDRSGKVHSDYREFLVSGGLQRARVGVWRDEFGRHARVDELMEDALNVLRTEEVVLVDPVELSPRSAYGRSPTEVMLYEFKAGVNAYLAKLREDVRVRTLADVIAFNEAHHEEELLYYGQQTLIEANGKGALDSPEYRRALAEVRRLTRTDGIDATMQKHRLDAIVAPSTGPAWVTDRVHGDRSSYGSSGPAAMAGYPNITVPMGFVHGLPVGISFFGHPFSEPTLLKLAYGFEQATNARKPPRFRAAVA